ncbi:MAG: hypothetical protein CMA77_02465 [Euryarchaeota archaeon]|nr:hypothetical protein [Euryarchaeota archaeon]|tara:strand:+ start:67 stop:537 length:471 start_codon:yes stop_codon:yes gene_type:complete
MTGDEIADSYAAEVLASMSAEAESRLAEVLDPVEEARLSSLSLVDLVLSGGGSDLVAAIMSRLGIVRAALIGHGGSIVVDNSEIITLNGIKSLELQLNLDGACVACGAAPGTLEGIQNDLLADEEVTAVRFSSSMLDNFDDLTSEFLQSTGKVTFV